MTYRFTIIGRPTTRKNSQRVFRNRKTGKPFITQSVQQKLWMRSAVRQLYEQHRFTPVSAPVRMTAIVYRERAVGDLLNYLAAVSDALEAAGVILNDKQVVNLDGCRMSKDASNPRVEVEITEVSGE